MRHKVWQRKGEEKARVINITAVLNGPTGLPCRWSGVYVSLKQEHMVFKSLAFCKTQLWLYINDKV